MIIINEKCIKNAKKMFFQVGYYQTIFNYVFSYISRIIVMDLQLSPVNKVYASFEKLL